MTDTSGPTIKRYEVEAWSGNDGFHIERNEDPNGTWVAFDDHDAHTQALRAENALLRDRLRLAVEARDEWKWLCECGSVETTAARAADEKLRASGVEI